MCADFSLVAPSRGSANHGTWVLIVVTSLVAGHMSFSI